MLENMENFLDRIMTEEGVPNSSEKKRS